MPFDTLSYLLGKNSGSGGSGGGATDYAINATLSFGMNYVFDFTDSGLTINDLVLDDHTTIYIETTASTQLPVWLDADDDNEFSITNFICVFNPLF